MAEKGTGIGQGQREGRRTETQKKEEGRKPMQGKGAKEKEKSKKAIRNISCALQPGNPERGREGWILHRYGGRSGRSALRKLRRQGSITFC